MSIDLKIEAKSDQLNADDLIASPKIIKISKVVACQGDQPIAIHFENDNGKPWKPSKGMRRVLVAAWGAEAIEYVGRSVELYYDASVTWAGQAVGGIRIAKMSHIENAIVIPLALARGKKVPVKILPLSIELTIEERREKTIALLLKKGTISDDTKKAIAESQTSEELRSIYESNK